MAENKTEARAELKQLRISPRKVGIVLDLIRNKSCDLAMATLRLVPKSACEPLKKLLKSAMANAENNNDMDLSNCYISECLCGAGPTYKRMRPGSKGSGRRVLKRTSNITLVIKERE